MPLNKLRLIVLALCLAPMAVPASAQDTEQLVRGRASYSPALTLALLKKIEAFCAGADKSAREPLAKAIAAWQQRHAGLLLENARVRDELIAEANAPTAPPGLKAELDRMLKVRVPEQVESDYRKLVPPDASKGWASKAFTCGAHAGTIDSGQYDLARFDPAVAAYLQKRMHQAGKGGAGGQ